MSTSQTLENTVLALSAPRAPEATTPVIGAHYGVPKHVYDLKPMGLKIDVDPPLAGTVSPGDVITLVLNGLAVNNKSIEAGQENSTSTLYINKGLLLTDRVNQLVYTITRGSQNIGTSTPVLMLLYNAIRPGMQDRTPGDGAHSELELILPQDVIDDGIDAERARQGVQVCFSYPYCRAHDKIWLNCNGQDVYRTVTTTEAPAIPTAEPTTVCVMVEEAVFERAGDSSTFVFSYTVTDQLGNGPDTDSPWSGTVIVDVHRKDARLVAPDLAENPDDPNDDPRTIDLAKLAGKDLTVLVHAFAPQWQPNDRIRVSYTATPPTGAVISHSVEATVARIPFTYRLMVPNAKVIAGSTVRAKYELVRNGAVLASSNTTTAEVTGAGSVELLPPFLVAPAVSPIDVLAYANGVTMRIEYLGALDGDRARLVEVNAPAGAPQFPLVAFNSNKRVNVVLTPAFLAARHGQAIEFRWNLNRGGGQAAKSPVLKVNVAKIVDGDVRLPVPNINGELGAELDIDKLPAGANIRVARWMFQERGTPIFLSLSGVDKNGQHVRMSIIEGEPLDSIDGLNIPAPIDWIRSLKNGSEASVDFRVNTKNTDNTRTTINFSRRSYLVKTTPTIRTENFDTTPDQTIVPGTTLELKHMSITTISGSIEIRKIHPSSIIPGQLEGSVLSFFDLTSNHGKITLRLACTKVSFWSSGRSTVTYYDANNDFLGQHLPHNNGRTLREFSASGILSIEIKTNSTSGDSVDYFTFEY
ncbi:hypothetical protein [Pseudomonas sp. PB106]|uniref:hypothetical protein n=1 Tax=Pseudomonas sp. PB106 TaxID=2494699 RepID=UPI00131BAA47|nr:hypothetical protein [Pseudomonas sp. PB106]KAE9645205.1 hypothetical protein EJA71_12135 [Pseudomonas sp. PB106]